MKTKNLIVLVVVAVVLGCAAYFLNSGSRPSAAKLNGKVVLPGLSVADVARVEIGGKLTLAAAADGQGRAGILRHARRAGGGA